MTQNREYRRSKDGIHWHEITFLRMKQDAWKMWPNTAIVPIESVMNGHDMKFPNGYTYGRIPSEKQEPTCTQ
jgi:hypothetical protein